MGAIRKWSRRQLAETRELVAGFWLWEFKDLDEAVAWVKRRPNPMPGPSKIEIRPLYGWPVCNLTPEVTEIHDRTREKLSRIGKGGPNMASVARVAT